MSSSRGPWRSLEQADISRRGFVGIAALAVGSATLLGACGPAADPRRPSGTPKKGGVLKVGITGGGSSETMDPGKLFNVIDGARIQQVYDGAFTLDLEGRVVPWLVEEATPSETGWKLRLRDGVTFHDGKPLTAGDVAWTYNWVLDEANGAYGRASLVGGGLISARALDKTTVQLELGKPNYLLDQSLATTQLSIFQDGTTPGEGGKFIGTGPFKLDDFAASQRAVFSANPDYWEDAPYLDSLEIVSVTDPNALVNAVQSGQVDVASSIAYDQVAAFQDNPQFTLYNGPSGNFNAHAMNTQAAPYNDPRVRKAMRLLVDREQQVSNGASGQGQVANDLFSWFDPYYASDLPQISYDPDQAKSLLKAAGMESQTFELYTTDGVPGVVASANLLAESANRAGVDLKVNKVPYDSYFSTAYLIKPFFSTQYPGLPIVQMWASALVDGAPYPETNWVNAEWSALVDQALSSSDEARRTSLMADAQRILHDETGYIIPIFTNNSDVARSNVGGLKEGPASPLGGFDFRGAWIES